MKKITLSLVTLASLGFGMSNEELAKELESLKTQMQEMQKSQESLVDEIASETFFDGEEYDSFSSMGGAASKVYYSKDALSIGGYGEYTFKKYSDFGKYQNATSDATRKKSEFNILRFVPYIGFKFNDWIVMNTEIEFEDGGARSDGEKNYKYAIVEFSYLDFLIDKSFALRVGHVLTPMGLINLNHEPVSFLSSDRPAVESFIIPSTWHANGILAHGQIDNLEYYAGLITSPDAGGFVEGRFIQQSKTGARVFSDELSFVTRLSYDAFDGLNVGGSFLYGTSSVSEESRPQITTGLRSNANMDITMAELHASYKKDGWNIQALAAYGKLGGDLAQLRSDLSQEISESVNGQYLNIGYNIMPFVAKSSHALYAFGEVERIDMDASNDTSYSDNHKFFEYTGGLSYFPDPKVVIKADYKLKDYASEATFKDETSLNIALGFIF